ncbi:hypothetical protein KIPB_011514, partial [Kipferlia bialata]|eukprot:g11514.t1
MLRVLLVLAVVALVCAYSEDPEYMEAYIGTQMSDAFSSIHYVGNGVAVAGKRSNTAGNRIFRSTQYGEPGTWSSVGEIDGYSGHHVYFFGSNGDTVITGTGDTGNACLMRSDDAGATWTVILSASDLKSLSGNTDPGAVYSPLFVGGRWIVCLRSAKPGKHIIESFDDGLTWTTCATTGLTAGARRMIVASDGNIMYGGAFPDSGKKTAFFLSKDDGMSFSKSLEGETVFAGLEDLGEGRYLVGTYSYGPHPVLSSYRSRSHDIAT